MCLLFSTATSCLSVAFFLLCGSGAPVFSLTNGPGLYVVHVQTAIELFIVGLLFMYLVLTATLQEDLLLSLFTDEGAKAQNNYVLA